MNSHDKFQLCYEAARNIVASRRAEVPEGIDPVGSWIAVAGVAVSAGVGLYTANKQSKDAKAAAGAANAAITKNAGTNTLDPVNFPDMPAYIPADFASINRDAIAADKHAYGASDAAFKTANPELWQAEQLAQSRALADQQGDTTLMPALQTEAVNAGVSGALDAFGDTGPVLRPGSAGEASVAKNLGLSIAAFQDRNRANRDKSLALAESIFPHRQLGLTGDNSAQIDIGNLAGVNAQNQTQHAQDINEIQYNERIKELNLANKINQGNVAGQAGATLAAATGRADATQDAAYANIANSAISGLSSAYGRYSGASTSTARNPYSTTTGYVPNYAKPFTPAPGAAPTGYYASKV